MNRKQNTRRQPPAIAITSADPETPLALDIRHNTPAVDMRQEIFGRVWGVTEAFCIMRAAQGAFVIAPWEDVALGHVRPARATLPGEAIARDQLDYFATVLYELDTVARLAFPKKMPRPLREAHRYLAGRLKEGPRD